MPGTSLRSAIAMLKDENDQLAESVGRVAAQVDRLAGSGGGGGGYGPRRQRGKERIIGAGGPQGGIENVFSLPFMDGLGPGPQQTNPDVSWTHSAAPPAQRADYVPGPTGILGEDDDRPTGLLNDPRRPVTFLGGPAPTGTLQPDPSTVAANQAQVQTAATSEAMLAELRKIAAALASGTATNDIALRALGIG